MGSPILSCKFSLIALLSFCLCSCAVGGCSNTPPKEQAHLGQGKYDQVIAELPNPRNAKQYLTRGIAFFGKHQWDPAISDFDKAMEFPEFVPSGDFTEGSAMMKSYQTTTHAAALTYRVSALFGKAEDLEKSGRRSEAVAVYKELVAYYENLGRGQQRLPDLKFYDDEAKRKITLLDRSGQK